MIKKVIFDLDNTLIMWDDKYYDTLDETLKYYNIAYNSDIKAKLIKAVDGYENRYDIYNMEYMKLLMEEYSNIKLPDDFVYMWTLYLEKCVPNELDPELVEILEYLNNKYELTVLTNWFLMEQVNRLKNYGILKYFKEVVGTEKIKNKPNKEAYIKAAIPYKMEECVMIGDSIKKDVEGAIEYGMDAILYDYNDEYTGDLKKVKKLIELKKYL